MVSVICPRQGSQEPHWAKQILDQLDEEDNEDIKPLAASNNTVTAGIRFYTGHRSGAKGLYAEIYGRYGDFRLDYDYSFTTNGKDYDMVIKGKARGFGGGLLLGGQFNLFKNMVVDLYIVGAHYGKLTGDIDGVSDLSTMTAEEKTDMENDINDIAPKFNDKKDPRSQSGQQWRERKTRWPPCRHQRTGTQHRLGILVINCFSVIA